MIFKDLPETEKEDYELSQIGIANSSKDHLGLEMLDIERAHHIRSRREKQHRSVIVKFLNYTTKVSILTNSYKLKTEIIEGLER